MAAPLPDYFALFGLPRRFALDAQRLSQAYRTVQAHVHPDRYAAAGAAEQRAALQWATLANEAYQVLSAPARRAAYLCELSGVTATGESSRSMAPDFLMRQMQWRQALDEARRPPDRARLDELRREADGLYRDELQRLESKLDVEHDFKSAADGVQRIMFIEKFIKELEAANDDTSASPAG